MLSNPNVEYIGVIPYTEVSTKIADCLACGKPFLVYASSKYPFVKYLIDNNVAHIAEDNNQLKEIVTKCTLDEQYLNKYLCNTKNLALKNHSAIENSKKLYEIIKEVVSNE